MNNTAFSPGKYSDFNGVIIRFRSRCEVKNATFEILDEPKRHKGRFYMWLIFKSGTITSGNLNFAFIESCNFQGDVLSRSVFRNGVFSGNKFDRSFWYDGEWKGKEWVEGFDKFGRTRSNPPTMWDDLVEQTSGVASNPGRYEKFTGLIKWRNSDLGVQDAFFELAKTGDKPVIFHSGTILNGVAVGIVVNHCVWKRGSWESSGIWWDGTWEKGTWFDGTWWGGTWESGEWKGGEWINGTWESGEWLSGIWNDGVWEGGYDRYDIWHDKYDSPDKWDI